MMMRKLAFLGVLLALCGASVAMAAKPIVTDSRIRTYVYSPNEVFKLTTEYGYQSNIVFAENEVVETLSAGDISGFKITPSKNRIFIRSLKSDFHTNMTVVTNERVYQFELSSFVEGNEDIIYVLRFYYPEDDVDEETGAPIAAGNYLRPSPPDFSMKYASQQGARGAQATILPSASMPRVGSPYVAPAPTYQGASEASYNDYQSWKENVNGAQNSVADMRNYDYTMQGPESLSPWQVFDDKGKTYVRFMKEMQQLPDFYVVRQDGLRVPVPVAFENGYIVLEGVFSRFFIERQGETVAVFNEKQFANNRS